MPFLRLVQGFFFPEFNRRYLLRILVVATVAFLVFRYVTAPFFIHGDSMAPTYRTGSVILGWRLTRFIPEFRRGDVVIIRLAGRRVALLKRIVGLPGEVVEFRNGRFFINGSRLDEPYVVRTGDWNLEPRVVDDGHYYVVGDNRSGPMQGHVFGQVDENRIVGVPLW